MTRSPASTGRLPVVVIVGRPNVGKSTLFNRLAGRRLAVVEDTPGITRDRLYAEAEWSGRRFTVVDTGGLTTMDDEMSEQIRVQAAVALQEADIVLFMVEAKDGLCPADEELADLLRPLKVPIFVVVNKAESPSARQSADEFYALGMGEPRSLSSIHGHGLGDILDEVVDAFPDSAEAGLAEESIGLAIIGRPNVGKSSLVNAILGQPRTIVSAVPGTTRDAVDTPFTWKDEEFNLIDTAGLRRPGKVQGTMEFYIALRAKKAAERAAISAIVIDAEEGLTDGDKRAASVATDCEKAIVWVVNKWDLVEPPDGRPRVRSDKKREFAEDLRNTLPALNYAPLCFTSALKGTGVDAFMDTCVDAYENYNFRITTGVLNRILQQASFERPYNRKGKALKIYYATMAKTCPPTIVIFVNDPKLVHFSYQRYLENQIRKEYPLEGTPLVLQFKPAHRTD
jgi:GTPase